MADPDLHYLSASDALRAFETRELSPVELLQALIARAEAVEPEINAFADTYYDDALAAARQAETRYAKPNSSRARSRACRLRSRTTRRSPVVYPRSDHSG